MGNLYYTLKQINNDYFINNIQVNYKTYYKIFYNTKQYKQIEYTCYFNKNQDFVKEWTLVEV